MDAKRHPMLLSEFLTEVYANYRDVKPQTVEQYHFVLICFAKFLGRPPKVDDLDPTTINAWLRAIGETLSPFTVKSRCRQILALWRVAVETGLVEPPRMVRRIRLPDRSFRLLTPAECKLLVEAASDYKGKKLFGCPRGPYLSTLIMATIDTAMRQSDLHSLEWPDVLALHGRLTLVQIKSRHRRIAVLSPATMSAISAWHGPTGMVWPCGNRATVGRCIKRIAQRAGLGPITHTDIRRSAIYSVEQQQPGAGWIFAGHASDQTTRTWYLPQDMEYERLPRPKLL